MKLTPSLTGIALIILLGIMHGTYAQPWVDTSYNISTVWNLPYGTAVDFAGTERTLAMDISFPANDTPPACGRPLAVIVHGGAWLGGNRNEGYVRRWREDFAKRGYVAASVSYRLGFFHTPQFVNCNVPGWNCYNAADTLEWYRANYRAVQDVNGALRYLMWEHETYQIDPSNTFLIGESAGGFIVMAMAYMDHPDEWNQPVHGALPNALPPNALYEPACIQELGLAGSIDEMNTERPALGPPQGLLNPSPPVTPQVKAIGNFYGGMFQNWFAQSADAQPDLFLFHQPCDLIVAPGYGRLLTGYVNCLFGFPVNCGTIVNRPRAYGSMAIQTLLDDLGAGGTSIPEYTTAFTNANYNCLQQLDANLSCHSIDNYWNRTQQMAAFFAERIAPCTPSGVSSPGQIQELRIYPNPTKAAVRVRLEPPAMEATIDMFNCYGQLVSTHTFKQLDDVILPLPDLPPGIYHLSIHFSGGSFVRKLVIQ